MNIVPPPPQLKADMKKVGDTMLKEWLEKAGPEGKALVDAFQQVTAAPPDADARACSTPSTTARPALAALFMVALLVMVLLSIVSRQLHFHVPGTDAYAGYLMAGAGFLALAHTLKRGEHIRVTLLLSALQGRAQRGAGALGAGRRRRCWPRCSPSTACGWPGSRYAFNDISTGNDATPLWIPQLTMAVGTLDPGDRLHRRAGARTARPGARRHGERRAARANEVARAPHE